MNRLGYPSSQNPQSINFNKKLPSQSDVLFPKIWDLIDPRAPLKNPEGVPYTDPHDPYNSDEWFRSIAAKAGDQHRCKRRRLQ